MFGVAIGIGVTGVLPGCLGKQLPSGPPQVAVDRHSHNWGRVLPSSRLETTFRIENRGGRKLVLGEIKTSCGCTKPELVKSSLDFGEVIPLKIALNVPAALGTFRNFVVIQTNDPEKPVLELTLFAEAWLGVNVVPQTIDVNRISAGSECRREVQVHSPDGRPFRIGRISADLPELTAEAEDAAQALPVHRVMIVYRAGERLGTIRGSVRIATDRADAPAVDVAVTGSISGPVAVSPASLEIAREQIGQTVQRTVILQAVSPASELTIDDVNVSFPWRLVRHETRSVRKGLTALELSLCFPEGSGMPSGDMDLSLTAPERLVVRIPLTIRGWTPPDPSP